MLPSCNRIHSLVDRIVFCKGKSDQLYEPQDLCIWTAPGLCLQDHIYFHTNYTIWRRAVTLLGNKQERLTWKSTPVLVFKDAPKILTATHIYLLPSNPTELLPLFLTVHDNNQVLLLKNKKIFVILTIALSSELKPTDMDSCIATTILLLQY